MEVHGLDDIRSIISNHELNAMSKLILGGGSNILFTKDFDGLVIKNSIKGISPVKETEEDVWIKAYSGEVWHELVLYCVRHNFGGVENLSLIPGTVGAAPIQNIGAYGAELKDAFESLEAVNMHTGEIETFPLDQCHFGYRDSIFKAEAKGRYFILSVILKLKKHPRFNTSYGAIQKTLDESGISELSVEAISKAVCQIRNSKLPNPALLGNAGSFFKNPEISAAQYDKLKQKYADMPGYKTGDNMVKVPAGWLIEQCGWKGKRVGNTGSHKDQALVLVNYGGARGDEIKQLAADIQQSVKDKFGISITPEVNIL